MIIVVMFHLSFQKSCLKTMNIDLFFEFEVSDDGDENVRQPRKIREFKPRIDPRAVFDDEMFKKHFRFSKESVEHITAILETDFMHENRRGLPIEPLYQVCIFLNHVAGAQYHRTSAWCAGISMEGARLSIIRVANALIRRKAEFIYLPSSDEMLATSQRILDRFKLPRFALAVDGVQMRFNEAPRKIPGNKNPQLFWCRKQFFSINCQVVANDRLICDIDVGWPGSTHDARIWRRSQVKRVIESQRRFLIAGDSAYPISEVLIKPYPVAESAQDNRKREFNRRLSGLRTVMSENLYGVWKRRFPILKNLRQNLETSQKVIVATAILFNMGRIWGDECPDGEEERPDDVEQEVLIIDDRNTRAAGRVERDLLLANMIR